MIRLVWRLGLVLILAGVCSLEVSAADSEVVTAEQAEFFEKHVRPLLVGRCYECHSPNADEVSGNLRLDSRAGWAVGGDSGPAIVPGEPDESLLIAAIRYGNDDTAMPPEGKLPAAEIAILIEWVKQGAPDPRMGAAPAQRPGIDLVKGREHWAFQPLRAVTVPAVKQAEWPRGDIDRFILAKLESQGLTPTVDADRAVLMRRLTLDMIGLPPTPEEVDAFLADSSADPDAAYARLVDRLLASPHFGERWGRHWLDVARYAESLTLRGFIFTDAWRYRDYVIETFNQDRPFDRFMMEQVAGDLLPAEDWQQSRRQVTATAFLALGNHNLEEQDKQGLVMDVVDEQLDAIGKGFLAQTITCARCHDHKFDPIPTADYYALAGILKSTHSLDHANISKWIERPLPVEAAREAELAKLEARIADQQTQVDAAKKSLAKLATPGSPPDARRAKSIAVKDLPGIVVDDAQAKRVGEWTASTAVAMYVGEGYIHDANAEKGSKTITFIPDLPETGQYEVRIAYTIGGNRATNASITVFHADGETALAVNQREPGDVVDQFHRLGRFRFEKSGQGFVIVSNEGTDGVVIADAVQFLPVESLNDPVAAKDPPPPAEKPAEQPDTQATERKQLAARVKSLEAELKSLKESGPQRERVISIREDDKVGDTQIHVRGSVHNLGTSVPRGFLQVLPVDELLPISAKESGRLQLARWLAHSDNPLPARVMANRIWQHLFGEGLVRTVDNFGTTGELPSHPELLDYLATRFRTGGLSTKTLIKEIVLSRTYRLASPAAGPSTDLENRLLARANRRRLDAECIRDAMLLISGQLDRTAGGPSYQPDLNSDFEFQHTSTRRSVYASWFRNGLPEVLEAFDVADSSLPSGRRNVSTVSTQALFMLNHPWVREQAVAAAGKLLAEPLADDAERLDRAYRLTLGRLPTSAEREIALRYLQPNPPPTPSETNAAWASLFQSLFASIDFRYVE